MPLPVDGLTLAELVERFQLQIDYWATVSPKLAAWMTGTVSGGPNGDGQYPLPSGTDDDVLWPCPARIVLDAQVAAAEPADLQPYVDAAEAAMEAALAAAAAAEAAADAARTAGGIASPAIDDWASLVVDVLGRPVYGLKNDGTAWEARSGVFRQIYRPRLVGVVEDFIAGLITATGLTITGDLSVSGNVDFPVSSGIPHLYPQMEDWQEVTVDALARPIRGLKLDGTWWVAKDGLLILDEPVRYGPDGETATVKKLIVEEDIDVPLSSGIQVIVGPGVDDWRELVVDSLMRPVYGTKNDGTNWRASLGAMIQEGFSPVLKQTWSYQRLTGSAAYATSENVDYLFIVNGQSLAVGATSITSDVAVTLTPEHAGFALMPSVGVIPAGVQFSSYVDLHESTVSPSGSKETVCSGMADAIMRKLNTDLGFKPRAIFAVAGRGGSAYYGSQTDASAGLKRGSPQYAETLRIVSRCFEISKALGRTLVVGAQIILHGEQDHTDGLSKGLYTRALSRWQANLSDDIRAITGQADQVPTYVTQTNRSNGAAAEPRISQAQLEIQDRDHLVRTVGPIYFGDECGDHSHPAPISYRRMGEMIGNVIVADYFGPYYQAIYVQAAWFKTSSIIQAQFTQPIAIETTDTHVVVSTLNAGKGLTFDDGSGSPPAITGIAMASGSTDTLEITLASPPTGKRPRIFVATGSQSAWPGRVTGARSAIRSATSFDTDPQDGYVLYHWACQQAFELQSA